MITTRWGSNLREILGGWGDCCSWIEGGEEPACGWTEAELEGSRVGDRVGSMKIWGTWQGIRGYSMNYPSNVWVEVVQ
eukprot:755172-Hanusia_phi.AAC.1